MTSEYEHGDDFDIEVSGKLLLQTILHIKFTVGADIIPINMALIQ